MGSAHPKREETCSERGDEEPPPEKVKIDERGRRAEFHHDETDEAN
jgi:hypothetical protein